ncbi:hypothetical protein A4A49_65963, partial [Nicotiana attenuata]
FCDYCKRLGHTKDKCYKLHGYPQNFGNSYTQNPNRGQNLNQTDRFNKGRRIVASVQSNPSEAMPTGKSELEDGNEGGQINISKEQYGQILSLLQHFQIGTAGESSNSASHTNGAVNFAGIIVCTSSIDFSKLSCECFKNKANSWILDSGASNHMTFNLSLLTNIVTLPYPLLVVLPNGYKVKVTQIGSVILFPQIILHKVMYIPSFKYNLISIHSL